MMYKILKPFKDKKTGRIYETGEVVKFTKKRASEILNVDLLIEEIKDSSAKCRDDAE